MAVNKMAVSVETSGISIAELRSRFQKEDQLFVARRSPSPRSLGNGVVNNKLPPPPSPAFATLPKFGPKAAVTASSEIAAAKLRLQKVLVPKTENNEKPSPPRPQTSPKPEVRKKEEDAVIPKVAIKPNRSHLSSLIVEVQQKCYSPAPPKIVPVTEDEEQQPAPPPFPPWLNASKPVTKGQVRLKSLPAFTEAGPPPSIPRRPPFVKLKALNSSCTPPLPQRNSVLTNNVPQTENPPSNPKTSSSPIPEYTEEQELRGADTPDDLYGDAEVPIAPSVVSTNSSVSSSHQYGTALDELYQDSFNPNSYNDEVYEDVGNSTVTSIRPEAILDRERKKILKEAEKKKKEIKKLQEKFGLTGNEVAVERGIVKEDARGKRKDDLPAKAGERISILKISGTPTGKWLVKNYEGRVGYMDLNNIEVNADSVRSVMRNTKRNSSAQIVDDGSSDLYDDGHSEAIYEEFT